MQRSVQASVCSSTEKVYLLLKLLYSDSSWFSSTGPWERRSEIRRVVSKTTAVNNGLQVLSTWPCNATIASTWVFGFQSPLLCFLIFVCWRSNILLFFFFGESFLIANACYHIAEQPECEPGWSYYKGSCYYLGPGCQDMGWSQEDLLFDGKSLPGDYHERRREQLRLATESQRWRVDWLLWQDEGRPLALGGEQYQVWLTQLGGPAIHLHKLGPESAGQPSQPGLRPDLGLLQHSEVGRPTVQRKEVLRVWEGWVVRLTGGMSVENTISEM